MLKRIIRGGGSKDSPPGSPRRLEPVDDIVPLKGGDSSGIWLLRHGKQKGKEVLVFTARGRQRGDEQLDPFTRSVKEALLPAAGLRDVTTCSEEAWTRHRTLRHPFVLPFLSGGKNASGDVQLITASAIPLRHHIKDKQVSCDELAFGVFTLARALSWLHADCGVAYNNVTLDGIFVTQDPVRWVLGDFAFSCPKGAIDLNQHCMSLQSLTAPEDVYKSEKLDLSSRDVYGLGLIIHHIVVSCNLESRMHDDDVLNAIMGTMRDYEAERERTSTSNGISLENRGLEALLGEVTSAIEWIDRDKIKDVPVFVGLPPTYRPLDIGEELELWALHSLNTAVSVRQSLDQLLNGRHLSANTLVKSVHFLTEERLTLAYPLRVSGYSSICRAFETLSYSDVVTYIVPLLCDRSVFLDQAGDVVYESLLVPAGRQNTSIQGQGQGQGQGSNSNKRLSINERRPVLQKKQSLTDFEPGAIVEAFGLFKAADLNGQSGTVAGVDEEEDRVLVVFEELNTQRAIRVENLLIKTPGQQSQPTSGGGVLANSDYHRLVVPFLRSALCDKSDTNLRIVMLRRARFYCRTFDHSPIFPEILSCLQSSKIDESLKSAACGAVGYLLSDAVQPKTINTLATLLHKMTFGKETDLVKTEAICSLVLLWGVAEKSLSVSGFVYGLTHNEFVLPTLRAVGSVIDSIPADQIAGVLVPLTSPLCLSKSKEVREAARGTLRLAFASLAKQRSGGGGGTSFPPKSLPTPHGIVATLPRSLKSKITSE
eukprot:TRINITY_DN33611_c0_g1_i1.p1 TRINITY_DN33611_c0_g1~~TRINITY_DN33611_c0_g1_i1.p1  ORF type:complete len:766 (+),score=127.15 TRINITY_DN33611_c0_g1_i1:51-2348(+)